MKNYPLINARKRLGLTQTEAAKEIGIATNTLSGYENEKRQPSKTVQKKICNFYRACGAFILEEDAFPSEDDTDYSSFQKKVISIEETDSETLPTAKAEQESYIEQKELSETLSDTLGTITPCEMEVIVLRYGLDGGGERDYLEIAKKFKVARWRIHGIEKNALQKLRHPVRSRRIEIFHKQGA